MSSSRTRRRRRPAVRRRRPARSRRRSARARRGVPLEVERDRRRDPVGPAERSVGIVERDAYASLPSVHCSSGASQLCSAHISGALTMNGSARTVTSNSSTCRNGSPPGRAPPSTRRRRRRSVAGEQADRSRRRSTPRTPTPRPPLGVRRSSDGTSSAMIGQTRRSTGDDAHDRQHERGRVRYLSLDWIDALSREVADERAARRGSPATTRSASPRSSPTDRRATSSTTCRSATARLASAPARRPRGRAHGAGLGDRGRRRHRRAERAGGVHRRAHPAHRRPAAADRRRSPCSARSTRCSPSVRERTEYA